MRVLLRVIAILVVPIAVAIGCLFAMKHYFMEPADPTKTTPVLFEIAPGSNFKEICKNLEAKGLVRYGWSVELISRLKDQDKKVNAGEYELSASMTPKEILNKLVSGEIYKRTLLFKEGDSIWQLGQLVENAGLLSRAEFDHALADPLLVEKAGLGKFQSFEGYLFPNTYTFSRPVTAQTIIWAMLEEGEKRWKPEYTKKLDEYGMSRHEILTLASIIEKESGNRQDQSLISSVFHNRLKNGMRLESDPTVVYGVPDYHPPITQAHLDMDHPYNTYKIFGLPPGPICNPGESAINAAIYPTIGAQYLFFVADGKGGHVFSTTLKDHNKAVEQYRAFMRGQAGQ